MSSSSRDGRSHPRLVCFVTPILLLLAVVLSTAGMSAARTALPPAPPPAPPPARPAPPPAGYDPMAVSSAFTPKTVDLVVKDAARQRDIPIRIYPPDSRSEAPVVMFSHGLGGSRENNRYLGVHWAARGYVAVFLQHPGSDESVWKDAAQGARYRALGSAANVQNLQLRIQDVPAVLDQLEAWNKASGHQLAGRLDLTRVGMSGHSFGAITTQAVSGQTFPFLGGGAGRGASGRRADGRGGAAAASSADPRIKAAVMFSPSSPRFGDAKTAFAAVKIPWLLMTGTEDTAPIGGIDLESRLAVFPALPPGDKFELVLDGAQHSAFGDRDLPGDREGSRNPNHHRAITALSTAFWDTYLRNDPAARAWLTGAGPTSVLEKGDRWNKK
jgi:predicted dienelactone hydrolase